MVRNRWKRGYGGGERRGCRRRESGTCVPVIIAASAGPLRDFLPVLLPHDHISSAIYIAAPRLMTFY
jgi:hypothetical protein